VSLMITFHLNSVRAGSSYPAIMTKRHDR
jgi:hypothetical protein